MNNQIRNSIIELAIRIKQNPRISGQCIGKYLNITGCLTCLGQYLLIKADILMNWNFTEEITKVQDQK